MSSQAETETRTVWLIELYRPGAHPTSLGRTTDAVRTAAAELAQQGAPLRYLGTTIVPRDEALLILIEAVSIEVVQRLFACADLAIQRISVAVHDASEPPTGTRPTPTEIER